MDNVLSIYEAKTNLSKLVKRAQAGQTIYIGAYGQLQAVLTSPPTLKPKLKFGAWADDHSVMIPDDFDDLDPEIIDMFENSKIFPDGSV
jgi:antitoxin (DNA-binding transcriptional repressor) of toxin-antitoxin stability system